MSTSPLPAHLDRLALAYEIVATNILREAGLLRSDAARAWARFWVSHDDPSTAGPAMRELTRVLVGARWQVAQVAHAYCRFAEIEAQCRDAAAPSCASPVVPMRSSVLIDLLAGYEGALLTEQALTRETPTSHPENALSALEHAATALSTVARYSSTGSGLADVAPSESADALVRLSQQAIGLALALAKQALGHGDVAPTTPLGGSTSAAREAA
jgi:hypothetical protein